MLKVGQQVTVNHPGESYDGEIGTIIKIDLSSNFQYLVEMSSDADGETKFWFNAEDLTVQRKQESSLDFSTSGLGIGGLATFQETPIIPTIAQIERVERLENEMIVCRHCGASDIFDGAMFTTGGGDVCDDCF